MTFLLDSYAAYFTVPEAPVRILRGHAGFLCRLSGRPRTFLRFFLTRNSTSECPRGLTPVVVQILSKPRFTAQCVRATSRSRRSSSLLDSRCPCLRYRRRLYGPYEDARGFLRCLDGQLRVCLRLILTRNSTSEFHRGLSPVPCSGTLPIAVLRGRTFAPRSAFLAAAPTITRYSDLIVRLLGQRIQSRRRDCGTPRRFC